MPSPPDPQASPQSICLILNERAANDARLHDALAEARAREFHIVRRQIGHSGHARELALQAARAGFGRIVSAGGDGTLNEVVNGVCEAGDPAEMGVAVGVLPFGTGNDFATACQFPLDDPAAALAEILEGEPTPIDIACANDRWFINVACGGFGAEATTNTPDHLKAALGRFAYFLTGLQQMRSLAACPMRIEAPGFEWHGTVFAVVVANGRQTGGGVQVAPRAVLDDGKLDFLLVPNVPWPEFLAVVSELMHIGSEVDFDHVEVRQVPWVNIETEKELQVNIDGEPMTGTNFRFAVRPRFLPFFLPRWPAPE